MATLKPLQALAVIPARGGSKGIPRKNIRELHGKPLLWYTVTAALESGCFEDVVVSTDHDEIAHIAEESGALVHHRAADLAGDEVTLDAVIYDAVQGKGRQYEVVATLQPTAPLLRAETLRKAFDHIRDNPHIDTLISVVNDPRLSWIEQEGRIVPNYTARVNRQYLPPLYRETGAFFLSRTRCVTPTSRFGNEVAVFEISPEEAIDIDTMQDWWIVEKYLERRRIAIRVDGSRPIGFGHIYRMLLLANRMLDHQVHFFLDESQEEAVSMIRNAFYPHTATPRRELISQLITHQPDIVILDILDTSAEEVMQLREKGIFVVSFEDLGAGMAHTHLTINALYESTIPYLHVHSGQDYYCLREEFTHTSPITIKEKVDHLVITFGGSDPTNQTLRCVRALADFLPGCATRVTLILGLGYPAEAEEELRRFLESSPLSGWVTIKRHVLSMASEFKAADLVITSCGRTMYEIASLGVPAILIAQNRREMQHTFGHSENGFANLGLGTELSDEVLLRTVRELCEQWELRREMQHRMLSTDFRNGLDRVYRLIMDTYWKTTGRNRKRG